MLDPKDENNRRSPEVQLNRLHDYFYDSSDPPSLPLIPRSRGTTLFDALDRAEEDCHDSLRWELLRQNKDSSLSKVITDLAKEVQSRESTLKEAAATLKRFVKKYNLPVDEVLECLCEDTVDSDINHVVTAFRMLFDDHFALEEVLATLISNEKDDLVFSHYRDSYLAFSDHDREQILRRMLSPDAFLISWAEISSGLANLEEDKGFLIVVLNNLLVEEWDQSLNVQSTYVEMLTLVYFDLLCDSEGIGNDNYDLVLFQDALTAYQMTAYNPDISNLACDVFIEHWPHQAADMLLEISKEPINPSGVRLAALRDFVDLRAEGSIKALKRIVNGGKDPALRLQACGLLLNESIFGTFGKEFLRDRLLRTSAEDKAPFLLPALAYLTEDSQSAKQVFEEALSEETFSKKYFLSVGNISGMPYYDVDVLKNGRVEEIIIQAEDPAQQSRSSQKHLANFALGTLMYDFYGLKNLLLFYRTANENGMRNVETIFKALNDQWNEEAFEAGITLVPGDLEKQLSWVLLTQSTPELNESFQALKEAIYRAAYSDPI